jgi:Leucine-rich repeat (LRR) protein
VGVDVSGARAATGVDDAFIKEVAALPAEQQVARVVAKLKELNPRFDPATTEVTHKIENGVVTEFGFDGRNVTDLSPVRALTGVKKLKCGGAPVKSRLADLSAIRGLQLTFLDCKNSMVRDLSPLRGMPLTQLNCCGTRVDDLSPLKGMPLTRLVCYSTKVEDLSPLAGLPLETLACYNTRVSDLSPLKGMPLKGLSCQMTLITDLTPLRGLPLNHLSLNGCPVSDLSPLTGTPLNVLHVHSTQVRTLTPLRGTPLTELSCDFVPQRDTELLLSIKTLKMINDLPAAEFWKKVEAGEAPKP